MDYIEVSAQGGNDLVAVREGWFIRHAVPVVIFGEDGNDTLTGGSTGDWIYGNGGDDDLLADPAACQPA